MILVSFISGCYSTPVKDVPFISENEAFKYERKYLAEYEQLEKTDTQLIVKWTQPANKKIPCKIYNGLSNDTDYEIYWDGDCKDGYANGLGREFVKSDVLYSEHLAIYKGKQKKPQYYIDTFHLDNTVKEGDLNSGYYVATEVNDNNFNFNINIFYGYFGSYKKPAQLVFASPLHDAIIYKKKYPNFSYFLGDWSNDEYTTKKQVFYIINKNEQVGFGFEKSKNGSIDSGEFNNGAADRLVRLPKSFFTNADTILTEIKQSGEKALRARIKALKVKKQYMRKICKKSISVDFIDNDEYKKICKDKEYYASLKKKIDIKRAKMNKSKQQRKKQSDQQKLIYAQVIQANAAKLQADAKARRDFWSDINKSILRNTPKTINTDCYNTFMGVNCSSTTY